MIYFGFSEYGRTREYQLLRYFQLRFFFTHQTNKSGSIIFFTPDYSPGHQPAAYRDTEGSLAVTGWHYNYHFLVALLTTPSKGPEALALEAGLTFQGMFLNVPSD